MEQMTSKNSIELLYEEIKPIAMRVRESILESKENIGVDASTLYRWYSNFNKSAPHPFKLRNMLQYDLKMANDRINRLIDFGFIKEKNNGKLVRTNNKINTNDERFLSFISHINSDFLRLEDFSTGQNANYIISGSISQNKHKELCSRIKEFAIKINEEISNVETENIDTIPVYFSLTGERFLFDCKGDLK